MDDEKLDVVGEKNLENAVEYHKMAEQYNVNTADTELKGGKLKVFFKRVLRKLIRRFFGWYVIPPKERQTKYNEHIHSATRCIIQASQKQSEFCSALNSTVSDNVERIDKLEAELEALKSENSELKCSLFEQQSEIKLLNENAARLSMEIRALGRACSEANSQSDGGLDLSQQKYFKYALSKLNISYDPSLIEDGLIDYFDFENKYRGSRESIKERQLQYLPYLKTDNSTGFVLELGFGRGEILEMLRENEVECVGVDCYHPFVEFCEKRGFTVVEGDALTYLTACEDESLNGIVLSQVAEHVNTDYLYQLIRTGYRKLKKSCCFIVETPNPESLATHLNFNLDGTHIKPVHYLALDYVFKSNGYEETVRLANEYSEHPYAKDMQRELIDKCEDGDQKQFYINLKNILFGATDLTIIARK